jgi:hypothetical protein
MTANPTAPEDWRLPERARPALPGELVERIDEALATAPPLRGGRDDGRGRRSGCRPGAPRSERASAAMIGDGSPSTPKARPEDAAMGDFSARADRVAERLRRLQRLSLSV